MFVKNPREFIFKEQLTWFVKKGNIVVEGKEVKRYFVKFCRQARVELTRTTWSIMNTADSPTQVWALLLQLTFCPWDFVDFRKCRSPCLVLELYLPLASFPATLRPWRLDIRRIISYGLTSQNTKWSSAKYLAMKLPDEITCVPWVQNGSIQGS